MTLLEVLIVMVILGLLATLGSIQLMGTLGRAKSDTARLQVEELSTAIDLFKIDMHRLPTTEEGLSALLQKPDGADGWGGPYLRKKTAINDPWGKPYRYTVPGAQSDYDLVTLGADARPGGDGENRDVTATADR